MITIYNLNFCMITYILIISPLLNYELSCQTWKPAKINMGKQGPAILEIAVRTSFSKENSEPEHSFFSYHHHLQGNAWYPHELVAAGRTFLSL
jgi:hypothetical protein